MLQFQRYDQGRIFCDLVKVSLSHKKSEINDISKILACLSMQQFAILSWQLAKIISYNPHIISYHPKTTILTSENNFGLLSVIMCDNIWNMLCFLWYLLLEILEFLKPNAKFCIFMGFRGTFNTFVTCTLRTWKLKLI